LLPATIFEQGGEQLRAGVRHYVLLSIVGIDHGQPVAHYAGKREQERLVTEGPVPWSIVRATHFHDFAAMVAGWAEQDGVATIALAGHFRPVHGRGSPAARPRSTADLHHIR